MNTKSKRMRRTDQGWAIFMALCMLFGMESAIAVETTLPRAHIEQLSFVPMESGQGLQIAKDPEEGVWIRGRVSPELSGKTVLFQITSTRILHYDLYLPRA